MTSAQTSAILEATLKTIELTLLSIILGVLLAFVFAFLRMSKSKVAQGFSWFYIWIFRGTPLLLQIMIIYFAVPIMSRDLFDVRIALSMFTAGVIALTLNTAAYIAEIIRAGIESIDKGQMEASKALGMSYSQAMLKVIIPQTVKRVLPPFSNEFTMILKDTSLVSVVGMVELMKITRQFASSGDWTYYFYAGAIYLFLTTLSSLLFDKLEKIAGKYE